LRYIKHGEGSVQATEMMAAGLRGVIIGFASCTSSSQWLAVAVREG
jgi:hypothetical protein